MTTIDEIKAEIGLKDALSKALGIALDNPDADDRYIRQVRSRLATADYQIKANADANLRYLLAKLDKQQAVIAAQAALIATVYWDDTDMIDDQHTRLLRELADAQAALEAGG